MKCIPITTHPFNLILNSKEGPHFTHSLSPLFVIIWPLVIKILPVFLIPQCLVDGQLPTHQSQLPLIEFHQLSILWHNTTQSNLLSTGSSHLNQWSQKDELFFGCFCSGGEDVKCCFDFPHFFFCSVLLMIMHPESHTLWYQFKPWVKLSTSFIPEILPNLLPWGRT